MTITTLIYALGSAPLFAARPFLAAFLTALLARFGTSIPWLGDHDAIVALSHAPDWFTNGTCLSILGVLSAAEIASAKSPEIQAVMAELDAWIKSSVAFLVSLAILDPDDAKILRAIDENSILGLHSFAALGSAGATFLSNRIRAGLVNMISDVDDHDDVGLKSLLAWIENTWTVFGILLLVLLPLFALALSAAATLFVFLWRRRALAREAASMVTCASCQARIRPTATLCHHCRAQVAGPKAVGVFGQATKRIATDRNRHRFELIARKRCPDCASRLEKRAVQQDCPTCGRRTFADAAEFDSYLRALADRLPRTLLVCFALSAIPLVGVIPGVIYYRLTLVSGLRGYIPPLKGCTTRFLVRLVNYGIIALQPIPLLGALILPLMCWSNYVLYRSSLREKGGELVTVRAS